MDFSNASIAAHFVEIADWLEIQGENAFRVRAYRNASDTISDLSTSLKGMVDRGEDISELKGIGSTIAEKVNELLRTGKINALEKLRSDFPSTLIDLLRIPGLGAKKVGYLYSELGVSDLDSLKQAAESGKISLLRGFGEKSERAILHGLQIAAAANERLRIDDAGEIINRLSTYLSACPAIERFEFVGSYRRSRESIGDIDILAMASNVAQAMDYFTKYPEVSEVLVHGETKSSIRLDRSFQADLRVVPLASWGAAIQYFTGSQQHNIHVRRIAKDMGYKLNEYGLIPNEGTQPTIDASTEEAVYASLKLPYIKPEFRENRFEFDANFAVREQSIINVSDIKSDLHMHTTETDGTESIEVMAAQCAGKGYTHIAITDHSKRVTMARGLTADRALAQWATIDRINSEGNMGLWIFKGIECDILEDGTMDLPDEVLQQADWVLASIHYGQRQSRQQITDRMLNAIRNPFVTAIAHPTGRLIGKRDAYDVDLEAVIQAAQENGTLLEINSNPQRLDLSDVNAMSAASSGVLLTINTDAHSIPNLDLMKYGVMQARRAGIERSQVINTWSLEDFRKHIAK
jgi:DNA polymerase (family X)